jgi:hypothetical protein
MERIAEERIAGDMGALLAQDCVADFRSSRQALGRPAHRCPASRRVGDRDHRSARWELCRGAPDQWGSSDNVSTKDLQVALKKYRMFFEKVLTV